MCFSWNKRKMLAKSLQAGFPAELSKDVYKVVKHIPIGTYNNINSSVTELRYNYTLNGGLIKIPYRIYLPDTATMKLNDQQRTIAHCLFSRSCDGYVRQKHIEALLAADYPDWAIPYIVKVCDEYVVEILEAVYAKISPQNNERLKRFWQENAKLFYISYQRMASYWNEFYRGQRYRFHQYIGRKLFRECFGYSRKFAKIK